MHNHIMLTSDKLKDRCIDTNTHSDGLEEIAACADPAWYIVGSIWPFNSSCARLTWLVSLIHGYF